MQITLFTTEGCHLCEQAYDLLRSLPDSHALQIDLQEIGDDDDLVARYGIRIPVVQFPDQEELDWPFSLTDLEQVFSRKIKS
ncbi:MAG: glutaredoxin family protein [Methylophaga sp.]